MSLSVRPARSSAFFAAGTGPNPMMRGSTPATPVEMIRAIGRAPAASPAFLLATIIATAPSLMPEALPAVVTPSLNNGRNLVSAAMSVCGRGCSSSATVTGPARPPGTSTAMISPAKNPSALAAAYFFCDPSAKTSAASRVI